MTDYMVRVVSHGLNVIGLAGITTGLVEEARKIHGTSPTASAALGRALTGGIFMGALLKRGQRVALKFEGNGPLKKIIVEADHEGMVRGYVAVPDVFLPLKDEKLNVSGALGNEGLLTVVKDVGLKEPYRGIVKLMTGEIGDDIAYYYAASEQIPSAVGLGVFVRPDEGIGAAGGFLIQSLPPGDKTLVDRLIENIRGVPSVTELLRQGKTPEDILALIFSGVPYHLLGRKALSYRCICSRERVERALISLGSEELQRLMEEQEDTEITCEYCRRIYHFGRQDLKGLQREIQPSR
jgi:molecular chaperone Hsp33